MRNLRKLTAVVIAVALVLTSMATAFAASTTYDFEAEAEVIKDLGIWTGNDDGDLMLGKVLTRAEGAVLVLKAVLGKTEADQEDADTASLSEFADAAKVPGWAEGWVALAVEEGVLKGTNKNELNAGGVLLGKDLASMFMNALGYADENDYGTAVQCLADKSASDFVDSLIEDLTNSKLTRDAAAAIVFDAFTATAADAKKNLIETIVGDDAALKAIAEKAGLIEAAPATLAVTKVTTDNLRTLKIDFNKAIDSATVTATTVKVTKGGADVVSARSVTEDNKSVVVTYTAVAQSEAVVVTVDGVKTADGQAVTAYTETKVVTDTKVPEVIGAAALNAKQVEVYFNEPINFARNAFQVLNNVKVDGIAIIAKATPNDVKNSVVFDFPTAIAAGAHTISVADMADYATYKAVTKEFSFTVIEDKAAPVMISAVAQNTTTIEVTFDEKVDTVGTFKVNGNTTVATAVVGSNNTKFTLTGGFTLNLSAIVEVKVAYVGQKDVVGNTVSTETTYAFKVSDDTALPTVAAAIVAGNKVTLTFSKSMDTTVGTITVKDKDGAVKATLNAPFAWKSGSNNTVLELTGAQVGLDNINAGDVTVNVKNMKDATIRANLLPEATLTLAALDTLKPTVSASYFVTAGTTAADDTVTFYFSEAMDDATLRNLSNYVGSTLTSLSAASASVVSVAADAKSITIKVSGVFAKATAGETFQVYAIKDLAGNMMASTIVSKLASTALTANAAETSDGTKVKVTFSNKVSAIDPSAFKVQNVSDSTDYAVFVNVELASDGLSATFTASKSLGTKPTNYKVVDLNTSLVKNIYNATLTTGSALTIADKVKPTVSVATGTTTGAIAISFTEVVGAGSAANVYADLIIKDKDGVLVDLTTTGAIQYMNGDVVSTFASFDKIVFTGTSGQNYTVQLFGRNIKDANNNIVVELAATTVTAK